MIKISNTSLLGVKMIEPQVHRDTRGFFIESYNFQEFCKAGIDVAFVQDNHSFSVKAGVVRGLHYQEEPLAQTKLVRVVAGSIYDVVVDLRPDSPTFGKWIGVQLSAENHKQLLVPKGCAHGFCTIEPDTEVIYKVDQYYSPEHDKGIRWDDPELSIHWPITNPILSAKDQNLPDFREAVRSLSVGGIT